VGGDPFLVEEIAGGRLVHRTIRTPHDLLRHADRVGAGLAGGPTGLLAAATPT
jgi:hypothetical protein